ncbi:MAG: hypothetical protein K6V73_08070 [Firmicutes bacterium]|nr:hypothetical protein [Bacillota bacterium]
MAEARTRRQHGTAGRWRPGTVPLAALAGGLAVVATLTACGVASAPGRPLGRPESSRAGTPGTPAAPRHGGLPSIAPGAPRRRPDGGPVPGRWSGARGPGTAHRPVGRAPAARTGAAATAGALFAWALGRPPMGTGAAFRAASPAPARGDRTNAGHRAHAGVYTVPRGHRPGRPLTTTADLATLPALEALKHFNGYLVSYARLGPWVDGMGYHEGHRGPALELLANTHAQAVGAKMDFSPAAGWRPWYDQPRGHPEGGLYTEHLYFISPARIGRAMSPDAASDLTAWSGFAAANRSATALYRDLGPDPGGRARQYGPPGRGLRVLVDAQRHVVGLVALWPADLPEGWRPWFDQPRGAPVRDALLGRVYTQHLWLVDPRSLTA